ncbi:hypothetical protein D3C71_1370340 [compost metagenome]
MRQTHTEWVDPLGLAGYRAAARTDRGVDLGRDLTDKQAISRVQRGQDVHADSRSDAVSLAKRCACGTPMKHEAHVDRLTGSTAGRLPHVHPNNHEGIVERRTSSIRKGTRNDLLYCVF